MIEYLSTSGVSPFSFVSAFFTLVLLIAGYKYTKWKIGKATVNCWFCNTDCVVPYRLKDNWVCGNCKQYNGFTAAGDYNDKAPAMHDESLNPPRMGVRAPAASSSTIEQHVKLCLKCTRNQLLKVKQLAQFEPIIEDNFEMEVATFKVKLDKLYALCRACQLATERHIRMQDTMIRGSMMSVKQRVTSKASIPKPHIRKNILHEEMRNVVMDVPLLAISCIVFLLSVFVIYQSVCQVIKDVFFLSFPNWLESLFGSKEKEIFHAILFSGWICSMAVPSLQKSKQRNSILACVMWFARCFYAWFSKQKLFDPFTGTVIGKILTFQFPSPLSQMSLGLTVFSMLLHSLSLCMLVVFSFLSFKSSYNIKQKPFSSKLRLNEGKSKLKSTNKNQPKKCNTQVDLNTSMYSDCSMPSDNESPPQAKRHHAQQEEQFKRPQEVNINGSLNALNLVDEELSSPFSNFKQPAAIFSGSTFPSTLHTPPPSRSSSLLSLSSHTSASGQVKQNPFSSNSSLFKSSNDMPFERYKSSTTVTGWSNRQQKSAWNIGNKSVASLPSRSWERSSTMLTNVANSPRINHVNSRPLISPAKLHLRNNGQRKRTITGQASLAEDYSNDMQNSWEQKSDPDVSIHDSVSQAGDPAQLEISDDEDFRFCRTPRRRNMESPSPMDLSSSSPKSTISNLTSITMRSVHEVENSRVCKWILAACLLINLVLVILLVQEVRQMREGEQWKKYSAAL